HRVDGVGDQVDQHLLQLNSIASDLRQLRSRFGLDQYSVLVQIATFKGKCFVDEFIHMERGSCVTVGLEVRANAFDHLSRTMAICGDAFEKIFGSIEIGCRTIKEPK